MRIPEKIKNIIAALEKSGYSAYIVGGSVRDILMNRVPKDWDITTSAKPEEIIKIFPDSVYENRFGTVGIKIESENKDTEIVEATTFRKEGKYSDFRRPDEIIFSDNLLEDLSRRDFTINAMAMSLREEIIDPFLGCKDIQNKIIRTVGFPVHRFKEDSLRLIRAVRFAAELEFNIEAETFNSILSNSELLSYIAKERIRDEFTKIIMSEKSGPAWGITQMEKLGILKYVIPELIEGIGVTQNKHHIYTVWEHNLRSLDYAAKENFSFEIRLSALLHDIGKPRSKSGEGYDASFYAHEIIGAKMAKKILERLKFSKEVIYKVCHLIRHHLFYYNTGEVTEAGVRRFIKRVGEEYIDDLFKLREADRIGSGTPKAAPYKSRHLRFMIDKVKKDPISHKMINLNGNDLMSLLNIDPCPRVGKILNILLEEILDNPLLNDKIILENRAKELNNLSDDDLDFMSKKAKETKEEFEQEMELEIKKKHKV